MVMFVFREGMCFFYEDHPFPRRIFVEASTASKPEMQPIFEFLESRWIIKQLLWKVFSSESDMFLFFYHARNCVFLGRLTFGRGQRFTFGIHLKLWGPGTNAWKLPAERLCCCLVSRRSWKCDPDNYLASRRVKGSESSGESIYCIQDHIGVKSYTPGSTNIAGWKMDPEWVDVYIYILLKMGIFQPAMLVYQRVEGANIQNVSRREPRKRAME